MKPHVICFLKFSCLAQNEGSIDKKLIHLRVVVQYLQILGILSSYTLSSESTGNLKIEQKRLNFITVLFFRLRLIVNLSLCQIHATSSHHQSLCGSWRSGYYFMSLATVFRCYFCTQVRYVGTTRDATRFMYKISTTMS